MKRGSDIPLRLSREFPAGMAGMGLFLLRVITALTLGRSGYSLIYESAGGSGSGWSCAHAVGVFLPLIGVAMIAGLATTAMGIMACALLLISFAWLDLAPNGLPIAATGLSLVLIFLGPGFYSLDAFLRGWRRFEIAQRRQKSDRTSAH